MCSRVLVALGLNPIAFPQCSRLPANLAGMEGLLFAGFDALAVASFAWFTWVPSPRRDVTVCRTIRRHAGSPKAWRCLRTQPSVLNQ